MTAVAVQSQAGDQFLPLQPHSLGGDDEGADERLLAHLDGVVGGQQGHQVLAGDASRRSAGAGRRGARLRHVQPRLEVHVLAEELVLEVGLAEAVEVGEQALAGLHGDAGVAFVRALAELVWKRRICDDDNL